MRLRFHAHSTSAQADDEVADCGFTGSDGRALGLMTEDGTLVRLAWSDGTDGEDEAIVGLARVTLKPGVVSLEFDRAADGWASAIPYDGIDVTYDDVDERSADLVDIFGRLLEAQPERVHAPAR